MKRQILLSGAFIAGSVLAVGALPGGNAPADYGMFRSRTTGSLAVKKSPAARGPQRVMAFADAGNAEVEKYGELTNLVDEDFSLLATGTETEPDYNTSLEIPMSDADYQYPWNNMLRHLTKGDLRWGVGNAFPAGEKLFFPFDRMNPEAHIVPPVLDLSGDGGAFVVEFRVKLAQEQNKMQPTMIMVQCAETYNWAPRWDDVDERFVSTELTTEWRTFRLIFQGGGPSTLVNIVGAGVEGGMFIDDVKVYKLKPYVGTPELARHSGFTGDSFTLNWKPVEGATGYVLNVWSAKPGSAELTPVLKDVAVAAPASSYKVTDADRSLSYFFTVEAGDGIHTSLRPLSREVFDITAPEIVSAEKTDGSDIAFRATLKEQPEAYGFNYTAMSKRTAGADGPFVLTNEDFTGWRTPLLDESGFEGQEFTKENPFTSGVIGGPYYPQDIKQQGWSGKNYMTYKDYLMLAPFFYTASNNPEEQACWVSPEFDLSADGGKITVDLKLAATEWTYWDDNNKQYRRFADCAVALFNFDDELNDYTQADVVYVTDLKFDWKNAHVELKGGTSRSKVGIFAINSYEDMYVDDIVITQNRKAGDVFMDPFYYSTWQLAEQMETPNVFTYTVPAHASGREVHHKAQAVRMHLNEEGAYDSEAISAFTEPGYVGTTQQYSGVTLVENGLAAQVKVNGGTIFISNPEGADVSVVSADGSRVSLGNSTEVSHAPGAPGVYVVCVGARTVKVLI